jgi:hypothetical protein
VAILQKIPMPDKPKATLYQHPSAPVRLEPPDAYRATPESIARAKEAAARERAEVDAALTAGAAQRDAAKLALVAMVDRYGWHTVNLWMQGIRASDRRHQ